MSGRKSPDFFAAGNRKSAGGRCFVRYSETFQRMIDSGRKLYMRATGLIKEVREQVKDWRKQGLSVGFVPTMGFLHEGHESLIARAAAENDKVVVSDFVNPIQFGEHEDLSTYPRDFNQDQRVCARAGADLIFRK